MQPVPRSASRFSCRRTRPACREAPERSYLRSRRVSTVDPRNNDFSLQIRVARPIRHEQPNRIPCASGRFGMRSVPEIPCRVLTIAVLIVGSVCQTSHTKRGFVRGFGFRVGTGWEGRAGLGGLIRNETLLAGSVSFVLALSYRMSNRIGPGSALGVCPARQRYLAPGPITERRTKMCRESTVRAFGASDAGWSQRNGKNLGDVCAGGQTESSQPGSNAWRG